MRRLKKADCEVDFFFIDEVDLFPSAVNPRRELKTLGEMPDACQHFFKIFAGKSSKHHATTGPRTGRIRPQAKRIHRGELLEETAEPQNVTVT